jgi:pentatricopeptide repeat protein
MSTSVSNAELNQSINPILADLGAALVFGLGFYFFKSHFKKDNKNLDKEIKDKMKPIRGKIEETINKWESAVCLQKINSIIKNEITDKNFDPFMVLDQLQKSNITPDISTLNTLLDTSSRLGDFKNFSRLTELINDDIQSLAQPNIVTYNIVLKGINLEMYNMEFDKKGQFARDKISEVFKTIQKKGLKPNDITLNTIIDILIESGNFDIAWKYYDDMEKIYSVEPDIYTYSTLLKSIKNYQPDEQNVERAFNILKIVKLSKAKGIKPDEILYNCILDTCVKYNRMEQAESVYLDMKEANVNPSKITYAIMIRGYGNNNKLDKALQIFNDMKSVGVSPNEIIYGCLLNACIKCNKIEKACDIYEDILASNITMNLILYTTLIKGFTQIKNFKKAFELYEKMMKDKSFDANIIAYNAILDCCVECGDFDMMSKIYEEIKSNALLNENSPQPDLITYSTVIKGYSRMKNIEKVLEIYTYLKNRDDMVLDEVIFNSILDGLLKAGRYEDALKTYEDMKKNNIRRSNATFSILIKIFSKLDMVDKAIEVYKEMLQEKMKPSLITYTSIIQILIKSKKIQFAIDIFDEILKNKLSPDQVMYNVIINGCVFNGRLEDACRFLFESFKANLRLCNDVYKNVFCNLLTNRIMDSSYKNDITIRICKELKTRGLEIDYELYSKVIKMCYKSHGKNSDYVIQKELEEYKKSCQEYYSENKGKEKESSYKGKQRNNNNNNTYTSYNPNYKSNGYKTYNNFSSNTGFQRMNNNQNK